MITLKKALGQIRPFSHTSYVWWLLVLMLAAATYKSARWRVNDVFLSDRNGYYMYLPSAFLLHDLGDASWVRAARTQYRPDNDPAGEFVAFPNGKVGSKYPLGMAVVYAPFFFAAKLVCEVQGKASTNGYESAYEYLVTVGCMFYALLGLALLGRELRRYFDDHVAALTILVLTLGTNLYNYTTYEAPMAHGTLFLLNTLLLITTRRWYEQGTARAAAALGAVAGLMVLVRPSEVMMLAVPVLWGLTSRLLVAERLRWWAQRWRQVLLAAAAFLAVSGLQFLFWKLVYGQWVVPFYKGETFNFLAPHVLNGFFSFRKGWLVYSPLLVLALLGIGWVRRWAAPVLPILLVLLPIYVYVTFCWWDWAYGGSYGGRALISLYPVLGFALAAFWQRWLARAPVAWGALLAVLLLLSIVQTYQYSLGIIDYDHMTWALYKARFLRIHAPY